MPYSTNENPYQGCAPLAILYAFFHPVPPEELRATLEHAGVVIKEARETLKASKELDERVSQALAEGNRELMAVQPAV